MKTLWLVRHAKTENHAPDGTDFNRALTRDGINAALRLGALLAARGDLPELVLVSSAVRAGTSAGLVLAAMNYAGRVEWRKDLYHTESEGILDILAGRDQDRIMVVGHNPVLEDLAHRLTGHMLHLRPGECMRLGFMLDDWTGLLGGARASVSDLVSPLLDTD